MLKAKIIHRLDEIQPADWNALTQNEYPYLRHEFLSALENHDCLGHRVGWLPQHLTVYNERGELIAALPMYLKFNSFGEFVFDWSWAQAYQRAGLDYYPKLVVACPFTPATGPRVLIAKGYDAKALYERIIDTAIEAARSLNASSIHWLFSTDREATTSPRLLKRMGCQFHWHNLGYKTFDDFLARMTSKKRKQVKRERRQVHDAGIRFKRLSGHEADEKDWQIFYELYCTTFAKHGNYPALTLGFFIQVARSMGDQILLVRAERNGRILAGAYFLVGPHTLYGRYWGCFEEFPALHFETCYYQGLDYCIERGLKRFEPGAQGEHKLSRGFLPTPTWSFHWMRHPRFRAALDPLLIEEIQSMKDYMAELSAHSPYRKPVHADHTQP